MHTPLRPLPALDLAAEIPPQTASCPPQMRMLQLITGYWISQCIYTAASLGIADRIPPHTALHYTELAQSVGAHAPSLYRLLRALASVEIFTEVTPGSFATTPLSTVLKSDALGSLRDIAIMMGDPEHYGSWGHLLHSVQTGESAFSHRFGMEVFEYYPQHPEPAAIFDRAMSGFSSIEGAAVVENYDFSGINSLVDVAGGHGRLLSSILQANPHMTGILFDMPEVIDRAQSQIAHSPIHDRCQLVSGSFFEPLPAGADAYLLKHILHDWDDARSIAILKQCHQAMPAHGKLLVVEHIIPPGNDPNIGKLLDINMLVMCPGGKERTTEEFQDLFAAAGFTLTNVVTIPGVISVLEAQPA